MMIPKFITQVPETASLINTTIYWFMYATRLKRVSRLGL